MCLPHDHKASQLSPRTTFLRSAANGRITSIYLLLRHDNRRQSCPHSTVHIAPCTLHIPNTTTLLSSVVVIVSSVVVMFRMVWLSYLTGCHVLGGCHGLFGGCYVSEGVVVISHWLSCPRWLSWSLWRLSVSLQRASLSLRLLSLSSRRLLLSPWRMSSSLLPLLNNAAFMYIAHSNRQALHNHCVRHRLHSSSLLAQLQLLLPTESSLLRLIF